MCPFATVVPKAGGSDSETRYLLPIRHGWRIRFFRLSFHAIRWLTMGENGDRDLRGTGLEKFARGFVAGSARR